MALPIAISISVDALAKAGGSGPVPLLLDVYPSASGAYSLRKLRTLYAGSAIRVRREVDNAEGDIGFSSNILDTAALMTFVGYQNLLQRSQTFQFSPWQLTNTAITINATTDPFGGNNGTKLYKSSTTTPQYLFYSRTGISNVTETFSIYLKSGEITTGSISFSNFVSYDCSVSFDLSAGTITSTSASNADYSNISGAIQSVGSGWYRVSIKATKGTINTTNSVSVALTGANTTNFGFYIFGAQVSSGVLQPYQETTTAVNNGNGFVTKWYDQSGSSRDAVQAISGNQPRIVNAGVIETQNSKPTVRFLSASTTYFSITNNVTLTALSIFTPFLYTASTQNNTRFFSINATGGNDYDGYIPMIQFNASNNWGSYADAAFRAYSNSLVNTFQLWTNIETGTVINNYKNGANLATYPFVLNRVINNMVIGFGVFASPVDGRFDGKIPEIVIYQSNQSSNRVGIESNINSFYTIY
jgi:hypothetical protein